MSRLMRNYAFLMLAVVLAGIIVGSYSGLAYGDVYINEIYYDPPSSGDSTQEYLEFRGTNGMSLNNYYLIFLEGENNSQNAGMPSEVEFIVDLNGRSLSPTGFLTMRQKGNPYSNVPVDAYNLVNSGSGASWGTAPANNTLGISSTSGVIENGGWTAMLIKNNGITAPSLGMLLDGSVDNNGNADATDWDGLDYLDTSGPQWVINNPAANIDWTVVDSIGIFEEHEAIFGRSYAKNVFAPEKDGDSYSYFETSTGQLVSGTFHPNITSDQKYVGLAYETEYVGRWGNSTGATPADWHVSNLTNNVADAGFISAADGFRQSGSYHDDHNTDIVETNQFVPYGTNLTNTIGSANYPLNLTALPWDYNGDGKVSAADYTVWRDTLGSTTDLRADGNNGRVVEEDDYLFWMGRYGLVLGSFGNGSGFFSASIPEPTGLTLVALGGIVLLARKRRIYGRLN